MNSMLDQQAYRTSFCFAADHPSFPGHFPDRPLVAGVLLLACVADGLRAWRGQRLARVLEVKFSAPLRPDERAELALVEQQPGTISQRIRFEIRREGALLARGVVEGAAVGETT